MIYIINYLIVKINNYIIKIYLYLNHNNIDNSIKPLYRIIKLISFNTITKVYQVLINIINLLNYYQLLHELNAKK